MIFLTPTAWRDLLDALRFLTLLPVPGRHTESGPAAAIGAFPLAGLLLGLLLVCLDTLLGRAGLPLSGRDTLLVVALVLLTGAMQLDGLMAVCDGLFGGHTPEERRARMRAVRAGGFGMLGGACVLLLKVGLLGALHGTDRVTALFIMPMLGRWSLVLAAALFPPPRPAGLRIAVEGLAPRRIARAFGTCLLVSFAVGSSGLLALSVSCAGVWLLGRAIRRRIPEATGDLYGALCELNEVLALLVLALNTSSQVHWL